jgi:hypothetical protein
MPYKDPKKIEAYQAAYRRKHRAELNAYGRSYYEQNAAECSRKSRQWRLDNPEKYRALTRRGTIAAQQRKNERVQAALREQGNICGLCREPFTTDNPPVRDHCHTTGEWRELLHNACNFGIGQFYDSPERCLMAAKYLRKWKRLLSQ